VGEGAIEVILKARAEGEPFADVDDFCRRVDLRQVNRRALESLIKVGALRTFGQRAQLLAIIGRMMGLSTQSHQAAAVGQLSIFDLGSFDVPPVDSILYPLPEVEEVARREILGWEKELVGVYVSEHPMEPFVHMLGDSVTCFLGQIDETMTGHKVTVAGIVNWIRQIYTKNGKQMAFVELEDVQGSIEVIVFPRVYEETRDTWQEDKVMMVRGKVDTKGGNGPKIICEKVDDAITRVAPQPENNRSSTSYRNQIPASEPHIPITDPQPPRHLHITVYRTGDSKSDRQRLRSVYELVTSYQGHDTFSFFIPNGQGHLQLEFPNDTTHHCMELQQKLTKMLGTTAVQVEPQSSKAVKP
jgi:DNA polymerase-3 subunit alpha